MPLFFSGLLHTLLLLLVLAAMRYEDKSKGMKTTYIQIETPPLEKAKSDVKSRVRDQIVQTENGQIVKKAVEDAFLGEKNQAVDRQTVSSKQIIAMASPAKKKKFQQKPPSHSPAQQQTQNHANYRPDYTTLSKFGAPILPSMPPSYKKGSPSEDYAKDTPEWTNFGSLPQDYVKGIRESEHTALNTKEFVFYGYFQRIRERLDRAWVPILRERLVKMYRIGRQLASDMDHTTQVVVVLNNQGEIVRVQILNESGTRELDDAAVRAFNQAGPFPNPPKGIIDGNGEIQIPWQFVLKT